MHIKVWLIVILNILDLDIRNCFTTISLGELPLILEVLNTCGLWKYIESSFEDTTTFKKDYIKIIVYATYFLG